MPEPHLFVVLECDRPASGGARHGLRGVDEIVIGRGEIRSAERSVADGVVRLHVRVPGRSISSSHARIVSTEAGFRLLDGGSTNGSFVNCTRVEDALLRDGDIFELGHTLFTLRTELPTPPGTAAHLDAEDPSFVADVTPTLLPALSADFQSLRSIASSDLSVVVLGESGTGKEVLARALHELSKRSGPFVAVNCAAVSPTLVESQFFGHVKGAFSGALRDEPGFVRSAAGGTLLLDEIGDLSPAAQGTLLRVLQEREVMPVGSARAVPVDVRFIAATHRDLDKLVADGSFRGDLLARLDGFRYWLPPLRSRREDIGLMIAPLLRDDAPSGVSLTREAGAALLLGDWQFNVRELLSRVKRAIVLAEGEAIEPSHLGLTPRTSEPPRARASAPLSARDAELKQELLRQLAHHDGNISEVARAMGKARMQIQRWIRRFGIEQR